MDWFERMGMPQDVPVKPCSRCSNETDAAQTWMIEGERFYLCKECNPKLYRLIRDWLKLGWMDIPAKENIS